MSLFSFAGSVLFLLFIATFCLFYVAAALSRFNTHIIEFKQYRDTKTQDDNALLIALQNSAKSSDEKIAVMATQFKQLEEVINQSALQLKAIREDHFTLSANLDVRFNIFSKQINELVEHFNVFQDGLSQFSQGLQDDNAKVQSAVCQVQATLDMIRNDTV
jgi:methyl-accepting chemotaxis protein